MALIPPDAGVRLRMQTEASLVQPTSPVRGVPGDLPELHAGQVFSARIQEVLPENTYRALVAGKQLTLQLPEGANAGDTLELVLIDRTPRTLIARRAEPEAAAQPAGGQPYPYSRISDAGRMIGQLLLPEGEAPQPAPLNRGQPLLAQPPDKGATLAPSLARAVSESGLFYEAHQAQWLAGQRPLASLRAEPQGQLPPSALPPGLPRPAYSEDAAANLLRNFVPSEETLTYAIHRQAATIDKSAPGASSPVTQGPERAQGAGRGDISGTPATQGIATPASSAETERPGAALNAQSVPEVVRPLVQQQLDAIATQRLSWHGEIWPGQVMDWEIERERTEERAGGQTDPDESHWSTTLHLRLPQLGTIDATLQLSGSRINLRLRAETDVASASLGQHGEQLVRALQDAGLTLQGLDIRHED